MYPSLTKQYLRENSLVKQFVDSYNKFVDEGMQKIIESQPVIEPQVEGLQLKLGKLRVERPMVTEADGSRRPLYPMEARMRDLSYTAPVFLEMTLVVKGVEKRTEDVFIGEIPVMLKSKLCYLSDKTSEELIKMGEDPMDVGGYFVVNGTEKGLITMEDLAPNRVLVSVDKAKGEGVAGGDANSRGNFYLCPRGRQTHSQHSFFQAHHIRYGRIAGRAEDQRDGDKYAPASAGALRGGAPVRERAP